MKKYIKKTIEFYDKNADEYVKNTIDLQDVDWLEKFSSYLSQSSRVLDVGCAYGRDSKYFAKNDFDIYGIDLSKIMIEKAKIFEPKAKFFIMDMSNLGFKNNFFDGIWCSAALLHISKKDSSIVVREFNRVLNKNGVIFLNLKLGKGEKNIKDKRYKNSEKFYSYFEENEIKKLLSDNSFSIIDFEIIIKKEEYMQNSGLIYLIAKKN